MALEIQSVLVTGSSRGIGLALVKQLAQLPSPPKVIMAGCRSPDAAIDLQEVARTHSSVHVVKMDVTSDEDIQGAFEVTEKLVGDAGLTLLINCAAMSDGQGWFRTQTREQFNRHFDVNTIGPVMICLKFLPLLQRASSLAQASSPLSANRAAIVMVSSVYGSLNRSLTSTQNKKESLHYRCSKAALNMAAVLMSRDLKEDGILVMALHPGWVQTNMGGPRGELTPVQSADMCLNVIGEANETNHGLLTSYNGQILPF